MRSCSTSFLWWLPTRQAWYPVASYYVRKAVVLISFLLFTIFIQQLADVTDPLDVIRFLLPQGSKRRAGRAYRSMRLADSSRLSGEMPPRYFGEGFHASPVFSLKVGSLVIPQSNRDRPGTSSRLVNRNDRVVTRMIKLTGGVITEEKTTPNASGDDRRWWWLPSESWCSDLTRQLPSLRTRGGRRSQQQKVTLVILDVLHNVSSSSANKVQANLPRGPSRSRRQWSAEEEVDVCLSAATCLQEFVLPVGDRGAKEVGDGGVVDVLFVPHEGDNDAGDRVVRKDASKNSSGIHRLNRLNCGSIIHRIHHMKRGIFFEHPDAGEGRGLPRSRNPDTLIGPNKEWTLMEVRSRLVRRFGATGFHDNISPNVDDDGDAKTTNQHVALQTIQEAVQMSDSIRNVGIQLVQRIRKNAADDGIPPRREESQTNNGSSPTKKNDKVTGKAEIPMTKKRIVPPALEDSRRFHFPSVLSGKSSATTFTGIVKGSVPLYTPHQQQMTMIQLPTDFIRHVFRDMIQKEVSMLLDTWAEEEAAESTATHHHPQQQPGATIGKVSAGPRKMSRGTRRTRRRPVTMLPDPSVAGFAILDADPSVIFLQEVKAVFSRLRWHLTSLGSNENMSLERKEELAMRMKKALTLYEVTIAQQPDVHWKEMEQLLCLCLGHYGVKPSGFLFRGDRRSDDDDEDSIPDTDPRHTTTKPIGNDSTMRLPSFELLHGSEVKGSLSLWSARVGGGWFPDGYQHSGADGFVDPQLEEPAHQYTNGLFFSEKTFEPLDKTGVSVRRTPFLRYLAVPSQTNKKGNLKKNASHRLFASFSISPGSGDVIL